MQYSLLLVSIAALAVSAPVDNQIAGDSKYIVYDPYASYSPYQGYPRAIEKEAAAGKRTGKTSPFTRCSEHTCKDSLTSLVTESIMHDVATEAKPKTAMMHPGMKRHMANMPSPEEMHSKPGMATDAWYGGYE